MKVAQISKPGGDFELLEREIPEPRAGEVRVRVEACGICHSDVLVKDGLWPGLQYPRVPGHEVAGRVDAIGDHVTTWKQGDRVGVGWHGGHDFVCDQCRRGDFAMCANRKITSIDFDGGYAEYMIAPAEALAVVPPHISVYMLEVDEDSRLGRELIAGGTRYHAHTVPNDDLVAESRPVDGEDERRRQSHARGTTQAQPAQDHDLARADLAGADAAQPVLPGAAHLRLTAALQHPQAGNRHQ